MNAYQYENIVVFSMSQQDIRDILSYLPWFEYIRKLADKDTALWPSRSTTFMAQIESLLWALQGSSSSPAVHHVLRPIVRDVHMRYAYGATGRPLIGLTKESMRPGEELWQYRNVISALCRTLNKRYPTRCGTATAPSDVGIENIVVMLEAFSAPSMLTPFPPTGIADVAPTVIMQLVRPTVDMTPFYEKVNTWANGYSALSPKTVLKVLGVSNGEKEN